MTTGETSTDAARRRRLRPPFVIALALALAAFAFVQLREALEPPPPVPLDAVRDDAGRWLPDKDGRIEFSFPERLVCYVDRCREKPVEGCPENGVQLPCVDEDGAQRYETYRLALRITRPPRKLGPSDLRRLAARHRTEAVVPGERSWIKGVTGADLARRADTIPPDLWVMIADRLAMRDVLRESPDPAAPGNVLVSNEHFGPTDALTCRGPSRNGYLCYYAVMGGPLAVGAPIYMPEPGPYWRSVPASPERHGFAGLIYPAFQHVHGRVPNKIESATIEAFARWGPGAP